jgi:capsular polysaccharide export protein
MLFDHVDTVYVGTSQLGIEALLAGKKVITFGAPVYGGWGFTEDRKNIPHRQRSRDLEDFFYYFYIWYSIYMIPDKEGPAELEEAIDYICENRPFQSPVKNQTVEEPPKVSVIIPVYNVERYLEKSLCSVMNQTLRNIEIIPVNDVSPDRSQDIINQLASEDPRIRPLTLTKNVGPGFARNEGLKYARGQYVWFLDPDDWLSECGFLKKITEIADKNKSDMVRGKKTTYKFDDQNKIVRREADPSERFFQKEIANTNLRRDVEIMQSHHCWLWLYSRKFLEQHSIKFVTRKWEERYFVIKALVCAERISLTTLSAVSYRIRPDSIARSDKRPEDIELFLQNFERTTEVFLSRGAGDRSSALREHLDYYISQFVHWLFFSSWREVLMSPQGLEARIDRVARILEGADFYGSDFD